MSSLAKLAKTIDAFNQGIGQKIAWLALFMVLVQFIVVVMRYVFGIGSIFMQESVIYMHGILFMVGAGYTLLHGGHVRVDIFYREANPRTKAIVDLLGVILLLAPVCILIMVYSMPYVISSWKVLEHSKETSGIPAVFLLKTMIPVFCVLVFAQGVSLAIHSFLVLRGVEEMPAEEDHEVF